MSTTLPLFWRLSSGLKQERIEASVKLICALEHFQSQFTPNPPESSSEGDEEMGQNTSKDGLDGQNAPDVAYSVRRLIRGLASPRESSRLGFAVALTELLSRLDAVSAPQILSLITHTSQIHGSMKGQEERDMLFARLFGVTSLVQSGILFRSAPPTPLSIFVDFQAAMMMLLSLPTKKSFLREPSYWAIILALRGLAASEVLWKDEAWKWVADTIFLNDKSWSPEKVGVVLTIQSLGVEMDWKTLLAATFKHKDILSVGNLNNLAKILSDTDVDDPDIEMGKPIKRHSAWRPQLHFVWNLILDIYFSPGDISSKCRHKASFPEFFRVVVDDSLLASASSDGRKLWGFEFFRLCLTRVHPSELPRLFTPNFMRSWTNHLSKPDRYLHKAAKLVASSLPPVISANPSAGFPVLLQLLQTHGHFDRLTRTKTVESLLAAMDVRGVEEYVCHLGQLAQESGGDAFGENEHDSSTTRIWVADQFTVLVCNGSIPKNDAWVSNVLNFLLLHGLFKIKRLNAKSQNRWLHALPVPAFSDAARVACRTRLLSCLAELTTQTTLIKTGDKKTIRRAGVASDGESWVSKTLHAIAALAKDTKHVLRVGLDEKEIREEVVLMDRALNVLKGLGALEGHDKQAGEGVELLLAATLLYRFLDDEGKDNEDVETCLDNVTRLYSHLTSNSKEAQNLMESQNSEDDHLAEDDVAPINAVVDTLIGYLEKSTGYLRAITNHVFGFLTSSVDKGTVELILAQLERRDPNHEELEDEQLDLEKAEAQSDGTDSDSDSPKGDSDAIEDVEEDPEIRQKIADAFRANGPDDKSGSESESSDDIMDDDQMMQLDEHLADIFRSRANNRVRNEPGAQREATHFKNRVLDLVDIFLRKEPTSKLVPMFILPLVQVISATGRDEKQLSDKVTALLRNRLGKAKDVPAAVDLPLLRSTLQELHIKAQKSTSPEVRETISVCSLFLTRILLSCPIKDDRTVIDTYRSSLSDFATRKASTLQPSFLQDFVRRYPRCAWQMRNDFVRLAEKSVNVYRKCQTFQLLHHLFNQLMNIDDDLQKVITFFRAFREGICTTLSDACNDSESLSTSQVKELLKLSLLAIRQSKRLIDNSDDLQAIFGGPNWVELFEKIKTSRFENAASLHGLCQQILAALGCNSENTTTDQRGQIMSDNQKKRKLEGSQEIDGKRAGRKKTRRNRQ